MPSLTKCIGSLPPSIRSNATLRSTIQLHCTEEAQLGRNSSYGAVCSCSLSVIFLTGSLYSYCCDLPSVLWAPFFFWVPMVLSLIFCNVLLVPVGCHVPWVLMVPPVPWVPMFLPFPWFLMFFSFPWNPMVPPVPWGFPWLFRFLGF